jgi:hypothetical protein
VLVKALEEYMKNSTVYSHSEYDLYISDVVFFNKGLLSKNIPLVRIVIDLKNTTVPWESMIDSVQLHLEQAKKKYKKIFCLWYICSSHGGIYLYETFASKETKKIGKLRNSFIIFNTDNGTVSLGPGHKHNKIFTERLAAMLRSSRFFTREKWLENMFDIFLLCDNIRYKGGLL